MSSLQWLQWLVAAVCAVVAVAAFGEATTTQLTSAELTEQRRLREEQFNAITHPTSSPRDPISSNNDIEAGAGAGAEIWSLPSTAVGTVTDVLFAFDYSIAVLATSFGVSMVSLESGKVVAFKNLTDDRKVPYERCSVEYAFGDLVVAGFASNNSKMSTIALWTGLAIGRDPVWVHRFEGTVYGGVQSMQLFKGRGQYYVAYSYMNSLGDAIRRPPMPGGSRWLDMRTGKVLGANSLATTLGEVFESGDGVFMDREYRGPHVNLLTRRRVPSGEVDPGFRSNNRTLLRSSGDKILYVTDYRPRTIFEYQFQNGGQHTMEYSLAANEELVDLAMTAFHRVAVSWDSNPTAPGYRVRIFDKTKLFANVLIETGNKSAVAPIATLNSMLGWHQQDLLIGIPGQGVYYMSWTTRDDLTAPRLVYPYADTCGFAGLHLGRNWRLVKGVWGVAVVNKREGSQCRAFVAANAFAPS